MKKVTVLSISIIVLAFGLLFTACFSPWKGDETTGSFSVTFGNGSGRTALFGDDTIRIEDLVHTIKLFNGPGPDQIREDIKFGQTVNFTVTPGRWDIYVEAYNEDRVLKAVGSKEGVEIKAGKNGLISITMREPTPVEPGLYTVTMQTGGNGTAEANPSSAAQGATVTISAIPENGYRFQQWEVVSGDVALSPDATESPATFTMPGNAVTIKALFEVLPANTPYLTLEPNTVIIDSVLVGYTQAAEKPIIIKNQGTGTATVSSIVLNGADATLFTLSGEDDISIIAAGGGIAICTVQPNGGLVARTYQAEIIVTYDDGATVRAILSFTVENVAPTSVTVIPATGATVTLGETLQFTAVVNPSTASQSVTWTVAGETGPVKPGTSIDAASGLLTVDATETAGTILTVTATSSTTSVFASVNVTVVNAEPTIFTITPAGNATSVVRGDTLQFSAVVNPPTASQDVTWSVTGGISGGITSINANGILSVDANEMKGTPLTVVATSAAFTYIFATFEVTVDNPTLTGTVTIGGDRYINGTVTANVTFTGLSEDATPKYQWFRQTTETIPLSGETNGQYTLVAADLNRSISVVVTADDFEGSITSKVQTIIFGVRNSSEWNAAANAIYSMGSGAILVLQNFNANSTLQNLSVNTPNYQIEVYAEGPPITISFTGTGSLLAIPNGKYVVIRNVNLQGNTDNAAPLVYVDDGGTLLLNGGEILGNTNTEGNGGGVCVKSGGTFRFQKGTIYGNESTNAELANNVVISGAEGAALYVEAGATAICVNLSGNTIATLETTNDTITGDYTNTPYP